MPDLLKEYSEFSQIFQSSDKISQENLEKYQTFLKKSLEIININNMLEIRNVDFLIEILALKTLELKFRKEFIKLEFINELKNIFLQNYSKRDLNFGIMNIFKNLGSFKRVLSRQELELKKLQNQESESDSESQAQERNSVLLDVGVMEIITLSVKNNPSLLLSDTIATTLLNLTRDYKNRGRIVQQGGLKVWKKLLKSCTEKGIVDARQGLARVLITIDPSLLFRGESEVLEVVEPCLELCRGKC